MEEIRVVSVKFNEDDDKTYYYECDIEDVSVDDYVLVDVYGTKLSVQVVKIEQMSPNELPFPVNNLKKVISKCEAQKERVPKDKIKAEISAYYDKLQEIREMLRIESLFYPFDVIMEAVDEKQIKDMIAESGGDVKNVVGKTITTKANTHFKPQIFKDPQNQSAILLAFSSLKEIGQLEGKASFLPMTLDEMISFACDNDPSITKIVVNPWSDAWEIPTVVKIDVSITVRKKGNVKVSQGISIRRDGLYSSTTIHDDSDDREQNWHLEVNSQKSYLKWFYGVVDWACSIRKEKWTSKANRSEIGIYYFYGNDTFEYVTFDLNSLPKVAVAICKGISSMVPSDLYLALTKYSMIK